MARLPLRRAALLHASHNLYIQDFFDRVTVDTGITRWLTGEFGAALAVTLALTALLFWRARGSVVAGGEASAAAMSDASGAPPHGTRGARRTWEPDR